MAYSSALSSFEFNNVLINAVGTVAFTLQRPPLEVTPIGAWNTYFIDGVATSAFTLDVYYSAADHEALFDDILLPSTGTGRPLEFYINLDGANPSVDRIYGNCIITGFDIVSSASDVTRASISAQVIGAISIAGQAADIGPSEAVVAP
jgi:hypothetical protein